MDIDVGGSSVSDGEGCETPQSSGSGVRCDGNSSSPCGAGKLKRSSSAPMINQLLPHGLLITPPVSSTTSHNSFSREMPEVAGIQPRARRLSANFGPVSPLSPGSTRALGRMRVRQLREEEGMDVVNREAALEKTIQSSLQMAESLSQSWEDLALTEERKPLSSSCPSTQPKKDYSDQLSLTISSSPSSAFSPGPQNVCSGASPTRVGRQCFSPSLQQPVRNYSFCPSPSPTKKTFTTRRSLSPIPLRPSALGGIKRKWDNEEAFCTPSKRLSTPDRCTVGLLTTHPHSLESTPSPAGPASVSSVGTPDSVCSSGSPGPPPPSYSPAPTPDPPPHLFKPVSPALSGSHIQNYSSHPADAQENAFGSKVVSSSDGNDAMMTDDALISSSHDLKNYQQAMDLSETLPGNTLNI